MNPNVVYKHALGGVFQHGTTVSPRGMVVREILNYQVKVAISDPVISIPERKLNYKFMLAEAIWILTGRNDVAFLYQYCKRMQEFSDDGMTLSGAYGVPFREQEGYVRRTLVNDVDSRQAVIVFFPPCPKPSKDIPCTVTHQYVIRNGLLHLNVFMRSWDMWLGFPYDIFSFSMMATFIAEALRLRTGVLTITAGSAHIYERDWTKVDDVLCGNHRIKLSIYKYDFNHPVSLIHRIESTLNALNEKV